MKKKINKKKSKNLWSGRFVESPSETMLRINSSISFDKTLYEKDISASKVHAIMLSNQGIISKEELKKIPFFVRGKARKNTEKYAENNGFSEISIETLYEAKAHYAR